jgi:PPOX class probable F420-dependent enzyme
MTAPAQALEPFVHQKNVLLTTYRRDGTPVGTPVHIAIDGDRAFIRTWDTTWKLKRIRHNPEVEIAPSTIRGKPTGPAIHAHARVLSGDEAVYAGQLLARKYPILHGILIPLYHRLRGYKTMHIELTPAEISQSARSGPTPSMYSTHIHSSLERSK